MIGWYKKYLGGKSSKTLAVSGSTLSACVAVYAAIQQGLEVTWFDHPGTSGCPPAPPGFDSLAPEGVHFLRQLLSVEEINEISRGTFEGIIRDDNFQAFSPHLGAGIQLNTETLKDLLITKIHEKMPICEDKILQLKQGEHGLILITNSNRSLHYQWLIDAQGQSSKLSSQPLNYLSEDLWVSRKFVSACQPSNQVRYQQNEKGWSWTAVDARGDQCTTLWSKNSSQTDIQNGFNCRWYKRHSAIEAAATGQQPRILLTAPTFNRFDPAAGLGVTLQIKSALMAVRSICLAEDSGTPQLQQQIMQRYHRQMQSSFVDIAKPMTDFYRSYGIDIQLPTSEKTAG